MQRNTRQARHLVEYRSILCHLIAQDWPNLGWGRFNKYFTRILCYSIHVQLFTTIHSHLVKRRGYLYMTSRITSSIWAFGAVSLFGCPYETSNFGNRLLSQILTKDVQTCLLFRVWATSTHASNLGYFKL